MRYLNLLFEMHFPQIHVVDKLHPVSRVNAQSEATDDWRFVNLHSFCTLYKVHDNIDNVKILFLKPLYEAFFMLIVSPSLSLGHFQAL